MSTTDPLLVVGVDVGASTIASGLVELPSGRVLTSTSTPTPRVDEVPDHVDHVLRGARRMFEAAGKDPIVGLGVGVCELVDREGRVRSAASVELRGERLAAELASLTRSVHIESDVRAHARAEATFGHGQAFEDFAFVSAGTGVSSSLVIGGRPYPGARGNAIVLASSPLAVRCTSCGAVASETLEEVASGRALAERWGTVGAKELFEAAAAGDERASEITARAALALGGSLAFLVNVADPAAIVIGGGLASARGSFWSDVEREMRLRIWSEDTSALPFFLSTLGPDAGIVGAACAAVDGAGS